MGALMERNSISVYFIGIVCLNKNKKHIWKSIFFFTKNYPATQFKPTHHCSYSHVLPSYLCYLSSLSLSQPKSICSHPDVTHQFLRKVQVLFSGIRVRKRHSGSTYRSVLLNSLEYLETMKLSFVQFGLWNCYLYTMLFSLYSVVNAMSEYYF